MVSMQSAFPSQSLRLLSSHSLISEQEENKVSITATQITHDAALYNQITVYVFYNIPTPVTDY